MASFADVSKSVALPAAAAALAYANAKFGLSWDLWKLKTGFSYLSWMKSLEKNDQVNVFYVFEKWAKDPKSANRLFLLLPENADEPRQRREWTYAEAYTTVLQYARWLKSRHGVLKGEMIAMDFENRPQFIWMWFALWSLGAIPAFINYNLREKAFVHSVRVSTSRILFVDPHLREALTDDAMQGFGPDETGRAVDVVVIEAELEREILTLEPYRAPDSDRSAVFTDTAMLIYTSGTTGLPKAANVHWAKPLSGAALWAKLLGLRPNDRYFTPLPLYHSSGSILGVCQVLGPGCTIIVAPKFSASNFMKQATETKANGMHYIGELCRYLVSTPPSPYDRAHNLRFAYGNGMRQDVWQRFKDRFNIGTIIEFYGATEGTAAMFSHSRNDFLRSAMGRQGLITQVLTNNILVKHDATTDLPYRDPKTGFCVRCATNESGELIHQLTPDNIDKEYFGYRGNESASQSKILRDVFKKGDAYYRTGDLQREDADGRWFFMDRIGDTFRWKSENVSTGEVAEALGTHPAVGEANVYGVELPNHDGRAGCAELVLAPGATLDSALAKDLFAHARRNLPRYAVPLFLRLRRDAVVVTGTYKHQKVALRAEGVDPLKVGAAELWWVPPGAQQYEPFAEKEWARIVGGEARL